MFAWRAIENETIIWLTHRRNNCSLQMECVEVCPRHSSELENQEKVMRIAREGSLLVAILLMCLGLATVGSRFATVGPGVAIGAEAAITLQGTGATFPAPLYERWFAEYHVAHPEVEINYQALGSGAGIKQFQQNLVDFGASE